MSEAKPFASLGPTLLARKGGARPAMRSQLAFQTADRAQDSLQEEHNPQDDLGWNDMGEDHTADVLQMTPANEDTREIDYSADEDEVVAEHAPSVANITSAASVAKLPARKASKPRRSALESGRRAAFTLRVDADRHLRLRLACTIRNRSAQELVTEALDKLLAEMPDLDTLASQVKRK